MKKKLIIITTIIIFIISSMFFYKYTELNNLKLKNYALKVLNIANNINQSAKIIRYQSKPGEDDMFKQQLITDLNSLGSVLYSGSTLIGGMQINDSKIYIYTEKLYSGLQDDNISPEINDILDNIINATDVLVNNFEKCYSSDSDITRQEILNSIQISLNYIL
ncbi:hypothetical protein [uncultured Clostridium sp.]|uniref:hypothetical protein n=1 Tax=uncultured Clostridium sp. TaxID=59620 RepID=UPI0025EBBC3D|nr:hypothetical protein [uncultured Clostridium sp.]